MLSNDVSPFRDSEREMMSVIEEAADALYGVAPAAPTEAAESGMGDG